MNPRLCSPRMPPSPAARTPGWPGLRRAAVGRDHPLPGRRHSPSARGCRPVAWPHKDRLTDAAGNQTGITALLASADQAQWIDGDNQRWLSELDWLGFGQSVQDMDQLNDAALIYRDSNGLPWLSADALGRRDRAFFDSKGNTTKLVQADDSLWQYSYNGFSEVTQATDPGKKRGRDSLLGRVAAMAERVEQRGAGACGRADAGGHAGRDFADQHAHQRGRSDLHLDPLHQPARRCRRPAPGPRRPHRQDRARPVQHQLGRRLRHEQRPVPAPQRHRDSFATYGLNVLAQTPNIAGATYLWDTSQAPDLTGTSGQTTMNLQGTWATFTGTARTDTLSVTETPTVGQAVTQTITFLVAGTNSPAYSASRPTSSSTWPSVLTPDELTAQQAMVAAGPYANLGQADGSVQTVFAMPSYNPAPPSPSINHSPS